MFALHMRAESWERDQSTSLLLINRETWTHRTTGVEFKEEMEWKGKLLYEIKRPKYQLFEAVKRESKVKCYWNLFDCYRHAYLWRKIYDN